MRLVLKDKSILLVDGRHGAHFLKSGVAVLVKGTGKVAVIPYEKIFKSTDPPPKGH